MKLLEVLSAATILQRVPAHMSYNVMMVDRNSVFATAYVSPDRPTVVIDMPISTNHQQHVEWTDHARLTATVERQEFLARRRADPKETASRFIRRFLQPPLYQTHYEEAFGTLYTAAYYPRKRSVDYSWPNQPKLCQSFAHFTEQTTSLHLKERHLQLATLAEK